MKIKILQNFTIVNSTIITAFFTNLVLHLPGVSLILPPFFCSPQFYTCNKVMWSYFSPAGEEFIWRTDQPLLPSLAKRKVCRLCFLERINRMENERYNFIKDGLRTMSFRILSLRNKMATHNQWQVGRTGKKIFNPHFANRWSPFRALSFTLSANNVSENRIEIKDNHQAGILIFF